MQAGGVDYESRRAPAGSGVAQTEKAGYGEDGEVHQAWRPRPNTDDVEERWGEGNVDAEVDKFGFAGVEHQRFIRFVVFHSDCSGDGRDYCTGVA